MPLHKKSSLLKELLLLKACKSKKYIHIDFSQTAVLLQWLLNFDLLQ